jgi:hypothetical protein
MLGDSGVHKRSKHMTRRCASISQLCSRVSLSEQKHPAMCFRSDALHWSRKPGGTDARYSLVLGAPLVVVSALVVTHII